MSHDELLRHTEPCDTCSTGIERLHCYDGVRRCRNCVWDLIIEKGWDKPPIIYQPRLRIKSDDSLLDYPSAPGKGPDKPDNDDGGGAQPTLL